MKVLFISNIPTPYKNDFYNEFGKFIDLTVLYEAYGASDQGIRFNWDKSQIKNYKAIFLKQGDIQENRINPSVFKWLKIEWDYIFVTNYSYMTEMAALIYLKCHKIPYVLEVDGGTIKNENLIRRVMKEKLISGAEAYFSPSKQTDDFLKYYGAKDNIIFRHPFTSLHNQQILDSVISENRKIEIRKKLGINSKNVIVGVGQLIFRKGWECLISIANKIDADIYIVGEGECRNLYETEIRKQNLTNVHLIGFLSNEMTTMYYQAADVFVLPTRYDVWGVVINEALANGLPVITTTGCIAGQELVVNNDNGFLIPVDNNELLLDKLKLLLSDRKLRAKMSNNALKSIKGYTIENMADVHMKYIYNK